MIAMIRTVLICVLVLFTFRVAGQDKKLDKLEMLYDQGHYKMVYRKSGRYIKKDAYTEHPLPYLYRSMTIMMLSRKKDRFAERIDESLDLMRRFRSLDTEDYYYEPHSHEIYEYQMLLYQTIYELHHGGKKQAASELHRRSLDIFKQHMEYAAITKEQPVIERPEPEDMPENISPEADLTTKRDSIIAFSEQFKGVPYVWGGNDPSGFDCSGYTKYVMRHFGYDLPRLAGDQYYVSCEPVPREKANRGDLVFFGSNKKSVAHVGIVVSSPGEPLRMIHAGSSTGITVSTVEGNSYWEPRFLFTGRVIRD